MIYGAETQMPATRMGRGVGAGERPLPEYPNETLFPPLAAVILLVKIVCVLSALYAGLSAFQSYMEKKARAGLEPLQLLVFEPIPELIDHPDAEYALQVKGAVPGRRTQIKFGKGKYIGYLDPVFREGYGDFSVGITGRELAQFADRHRTIVGRIPGTKESGDVTIYMYAQEDRPNMIDLRTPVEAVRVHIPSMVETIAEQIIPGWTAPLPVTPGDAAIGYAVGSRYEIKFGLPILSLLPGVPYTPGMWIPWGCIITEV
jgi:hypothetical protein